MTTLPGTGTFAPVPPAAVAGPPDRRGSWLPTWAMIATRFMELRKRQGLMIALVVVTIGIPTIYLSVRLLLHAVAPNSYGPAGGYDVYTTLVAGIMYVFGFIFAATLGCTAGSIDLTEGMFRHLVVTGRSRLALYLARIPAGLAIVASLVAVGYTVVCAVCVFAAPTRNDFDGVIVPAALSRAGLVSWAADHADEVVCNFGVDIGPSTPDGSTIAEVVNNVPCGSGPAGGPATVVGQPPGPQGQPRSTQAQITVAARLIAQLDYSGYTSHFLSPPVSLMIRSGLWIELEAAIGFVVGLGLGSLLGQRTVAVILMIVLELVLTPIFSIHAVPHLLNVQRGVVGLAMAHIEPAGLPLAFGGGPRGGGAPPGASLLLPETRTVAICVIVAWLVGWTVLGAWRMMTRDA